MKHDYLISMLHSQYESLFKAEAELGRAILNGCPKHEIENIKWGVKAIKQQINYTIESRVNGD